MKIRSLGLVFAAAALSSAASLSAADFAIHGSYWDTDAAGDTAGGGLSLGLPLNDVIGVDLRATYYEELSDDPFENAFDSDDPVFQDRGIQVLPLEAGLRFTFSPDSTFRPYIGAGGSYFMLDSDFGEISDELGYYAVAGATIGDDEGAQFYFEGLWRKATAEVELDPEDLEDVDDIEVDDHADLDLDGLGVNVGVRWTF
jgi:outer membrane protein W